MVISLVFNLLCPTAPANLQSGPTMLPSGFKQVRAVRSRHPRDAGSPYGMGVIANSYCFEGDDPAFVEVARLSLADFPACLPPKRILAVGLAQPGREAETAALLRDLIADVPGLVNAVIRDRPPYWRTPTARTCWTAYAMRGGGNEDVVRVVGFALGH